MYQSERNSCEDESGFGYGPLVGCGEECLSFITTGIFLNS
jgi:hypothetical protein